MTPAGAWRLHDAGPVVVGGIGGSGTRVIARLLQGLGFFLGGDLNGALDNKWFGFLLGGRSEWYRSGGRAQVPAVLRLFEQAMRGRPSIGAREQAILAEASREWGEWAVKSMGLDPVSAQRRTLDRIRPLTESTGPEPGAVGWGWKNPNAHIFVEHLAAAFPGMRYVHVIRDGLDLVAKQKVIRQARDWGPLLGVEPEEGRECATAADALRYWIAANRRVLKLGPALFGDRFLVLRYESVCAGPTETVARMADFLDLRADPDLVASFSSFVTSPSADSDDRVARYRFPADLLADARAVL